MSYQTTSTSAPLPIIQEFARRKHHPITIPKDLGHRTIELNARARPVQHRAVAHRNSAPTRNCGSPHRLGLRLCVHHLAAGHAAMACSFRLPPGEGVAAQGVSCAQGARTTTPDLSPSLAPNPSLVWSAHLPRPRTECGPTPVAPKSHAAASTYHQPEAPGPPISARPPRHVCPSRNHDAGAAAAERRSTRAHRAPRRAAEVEMGGGRGEEPLPYTTSHVCLGAWSLEIAVGRRLSKRRPTRSRGSWRGGPPWSARRGRRRRRRAPPSGRPRPGRRTASSRPRCGGRRSR